MNDILLTPEAIKGHAADAVMDATNTDGEIEDVIAAHIEKACRAQVRKVVEWMEKVGTEFNGVDDPSWRHKALLWSDWKALRAAGEKEVGNR